MKLFFIFILFFLYELKDCKLGYLSKSIWNLQWDMKVLNDISKSFDKNSIESLQSLRCMNKIINNVTPLDNNTKIKNKIESKKTRFV